MEEKLALMEQGQSIYSSLERFESAQRMAKSLSASDYVPDTFRNNIPNTLIAIEVAARYGHLDNAPSVLAVMQSMYVVHGKPGFESKFIIALVNTCGRFSPMRWQWTGQPGSTVWGARAVCKDLKTGDVLTGTLVDMEMAQREGWLTKKGSKWQSMPEQMLQYRSAAFWCRAYAPELLQGMHMVDELEDSQDDEKTVAQAEVVGDTGNSLDALADELSDEPTQENLQY